jgi:hypothetical protein
VRLAVVTGNPATEQNEADVQVGVSITDVRRQGTLADYTGELQVNAGLRITDRLNSPAGTSPATTEDTSFPVTTLCTSTESTTIGSSCTLSSSFNAIVPGAIVEGKRAIWQLGQVEVFDGGADDLAATGPNGLFARQGIFVP